jgi:Cft2 family RNA processing exonuclease
MDGRCASMSCSWILAHSLHRTIIIDVGKNFQAAALEWFPKYSLRSIDALLISHAHADGMFSLHLRHNTEFTLLCIAMHGLDDLRSEFVRK